MTYEGSTVPTDPGLTGRLTPSCSMVSIYLYPSSEMSTTVGKRDIYLFHAPSVVVTLPRARGISRTFPVGCNVTTTYPRARGNGT
jgi:hypothetical protein